MYKRITLFNLTHMMSIVNTIAIGVEILRWIVDSIWRKFSLN